MSHATSRGRRGVLAVTLTALVVAAACAGTQPRNIGTGTTAPTAPPGVR